MSSFAKMQIDTMWKTKHVKTCKRLFEFLLLVYKVVQSHTMTADTRHIVVAFGLTGFGS